MRQVKISQVLHTPGFPFNYQWPGPCPFPEVTAYMPFRAPPPTPAPNSRQAEYF